MTALLYRLGRGAVRRRRLIVLAWALVAIGVISLAQTAGGSMSDTFTIPGAESQRALDVLEEDFPSEAGTSAQLVFAVPQATCGTRLDPAAARAVVAALADVATQPDVGQVGELQRSPDGRIGYADVQYLRPAEDIRDAAYERLEATAHTTNEAGAVRMELGGDLPSDAADDVSGGQEMVGVIMAVIVLLVAFGSVIAMGLPTGLALVGLATSLGLITLVAALVDVHTVAPTLAAMIGLGVGIDYALFIVTRHREHLRAGMTVEEAAGRAIATSGSAVLFAGVTVIIAISGLAIAGMTAITVMGLMAGLTVAVMVALALTLLPALLGFAGRRIDSWRVPGTRGGVPAPDQESIWHRWGRQVSAHPLRYLSAGTLVLVLLTAPLFSMRLGMTDNGTNPTSMTTRRAYDLLAEGFGPGFNGPLVLSVELDGATVDDLAPLEAALAADVGVQAVSPIQPNDERTAAVLRVVPTSAPQDEATTDLVHRLRDDVIPEALADAPGAEVRVGGLTAMFIDLSDQVSDRLVWFIGAVILLSVLLLT